MATSSTLAPAITALQRRWGEPALRTGATLHTAPSSIPTGSPALDTLLGGGVPRGAITEIRGRDGSGARSLALALAAQAQAGDELVAYLDLGATFDTEYALMRGVDPAHLLVVRPADVAEALAVIQALLASGDAGVVVVDALTALMRTAAAARRFGAAVARWAPLVARTGCALIGLVDEAAAGSQALGAGSAPADAATLRLHTQRSGWIEQPGLFDPHTRLAGTVSRVTVLSQAGRVVPESVSLTFPLSLP